MIGTVFLHNLLLAVDASGEIYPKAHVFATETAVFEAVDQLRHVDVEFPEAARTFTVPLRQDAPDSVGLSPASSP